MLLAPLVLLWGCAGLTSGNSARTSTPSPQTYGISGTISPTAGGAGATVTLGGAAAATTTANSAGGYSFLSLANGSYTITPANLGFSFAPASQNVKVNAANVSGVNFTATPQPTHSVSLTWSASPTTTVTLYNIYRSTVSGNLYAKVGATQAPGLSYTDTLVQNGTTYYYVTTAVDASGSESVYSNQVSAVIP